MATRRDTEGVDDFFDLGLYRVDLDDRCLMALGRVLTRVGQRLAHPLEIALPSFIGRLFPSGQSS